MKRLFTLSVFLFLYSFAFSQSWVSQPANNYVSSGRTRSTAFYINGVIYSIGGSDNCCYYPSQVYAFDTLTQTWTQKASTYPNSRESNGKVSVVINGKAYVGQGVNAGYTWDNSFYSYDPVTDTWTPIASFPGSPRAYATAFTLNDKMYVIGGSNGFNLTGMKDCYVYDPSNDQWTQLNDCPARGVNAFPVAFTIGNKAYVGTGDSVSSAGNNQTPFNDFWEYDPAGDNWTKKASLPGVPRSEAIGFGTCDKGYIGGGWSDGTNQGGSALSDFYQYDQATDTWKRIEDFGGGPIQGSRTFVVNNIGYLFGGITHNANNNTNTYLNTMWSYRPGPAFSSPNIICAGQSITFADTTNFIPTSWSWTFPGGSPATSTSQNPVVTYNTAGNYDVTLYAASACYNSVKTFSNYVTVKGAGSLVPTALPPQVCTGEGSTLSVTVQGNANYIWAPSQGLSSTQGPSVTARPDITTTYTVVSFGGGCGIDTANVVVTVLPTPNVRAHDTSVCSGLSITLNASGATDYLWKPATYLNCTTCQNPVATPTATITYTLVGSNGSCADSTQVEVSLGTSAIPGSVTAVRDTLCAGTPGSLVLSGNSSNIIEWQSSTDNSNFTDILPAPDTTKFRTQPILQSTWYRVIVGSGTCIDTTDVFGLIVPPPLTALFDDTQNGLKANFNSSGSTGNIRNYYWDFSDGKTSTQANPQHTFPKDTLYDVCLTIYDGSNCSYTFCRSIALYPNGVIAINGNSNWNIYPNPFGNTLTIDAKAINAPVLGIDMYDVLGRPVITKGKEESNNATIELDGSSLAKGMYYLVIKTADATYMQKVVKQ